MHQLQQNQQQVFYPSQQFKQQAHISSLEEYKRLYEESIRNPTKFWLQIALKNFYWKKAPTEKNFLNFNFNPTGSIFIEWMKGAKTNICYNAIDRIIDTLGNGDKLAYIWEGNSPGEEKKITYNELRDEVSKFANVLKSHGVMKGSRVAIYMPVTIELVIAMLGCARIGAIHTVVFAGFSAEALAERIVDAKCVVLVTADGYYRGSKLIMLKEIAADALDKSAQRNNVIKTCIVHRRLNLPTVQSNKGLLTVTSAPHQPTFGVLNNNNNLNSNNNVNNASSPAVDSSLQQQQQQQRNSRHAQQQQQQQQQQNGNNKDQEQQKPPTVPWNNDVDEWWDILMDKASTDCEPVWVDAEDPLFILYTSGSTGKPKGVVHTTGGYMVYAATTFKYVFNYKDDDVFFCTADLGWITGHTVNVYGSLCNGTTITLFEGTPFYPDPGRLWQIVDANKVTTFYTAPTAIRSLMRYNESYVTSYSKTSLRLLGTAGEPINPEAWHWYNEMVGSRNCPIVDTFWQTETAAPMLTPLPAATPLKPGSATFPFFGVEPAIIDENGRELDGPAVGELVFKSPWPGMMRAIDGDQARFETYFSKFPGYYATGDHVKRDEDGYYWVLGRADDMLNVSGHLLSTAEVESALAEHTGIAEAAAVSFLHDIKGEALFCYVVMKDDSKFGPEVEEQLRYIVRNKIGPVASPDVIKCLKQLPKTRSGKTMRRILRKASRNDFNLGDISTLADTSALLELFPNGYNGSCDQLADIIHGRT